jgi:putative SOS response-associated peptidase YedK
MCGRFAQAQTREEYLAYLSDEADRDIAYDPSRLDVTTWRQVPKSCC